MAPRKTNFPVLVAAVAALAIGAAVLAVLLALPDGDEPIPAPGPAESSPGGANEAGDGAGKAAHAADSPAGGGKRPPEAGEDAGASLPGAGPGEETRREEDPRGRKPLLRGTVTDDAGHPAAGVAVALAAEVAWTLGPDLDLGELLRTVARPDAIAARTETAADGAFAFYPGDAPDGAYCLRASAPGFATALVHRVEVQAGREGKMSPVALEKAAALSGTVEDSDQGGVAGASLVALGRPDPEKVLDGRAFLDQRWTVSGPGGRFRFDDLPPGPVTLLVRAAGYADTAREGVEAPAENVTVRLRGGLAIRGRVLEEGTGRPVAGARILVSAGVAGGGGFAQAVSDPDGCFEVPGLPPGPYRVAVGAAGFTEATLDADGSAGGTLELEARLKRGIRVAGRVLEEGTRKPVAGAKVFVAPIGGGATPGSAPRAESAADGSFSLEGVHFREPGGGGGGPEGGSPLTLMASRPGWFLPDPVVLRERDDPGNVEILMKPACLVEGKVVDPDGRPVAGARVTLAGGDDSDAMLRLMGVGLPTSCETGAEGAFSLFARSDGGKPRRVEVRHPDWCFESADLRGLSPETPADALEIRLGAGGRIEGSALGPKGEPAGGFRVAYVFLKDAQGRKWERRDSPFGGSGVEQTAVGPDGAFRIERLRPGEWGLTLRSGKTDVSLQETVVVVQGKTSRAELRVAPRLAVAGVVVDDTGAPLKDATVEVFGARRWGIGPARTGADGAFRIEGLLPGEHDVAAWCEGHHEVRFLKMQAGTEDGRVILMKAFSIRGVVVDENGEPVEGADFTATNTARIKPGTRSKGWPDERDETGGRTRKGGVLELGGLTRGVYEICVRTTVWTDKLEQRETRVHVSAGAENVRIVVPAGSKR
ncbi:MAG: carboxypeptidase-like regulatory domain-containing protein [Planctomycetes bacterium]|nr:carboxypeptidase-like regulatory domain-containing protein [Planctomycetota bacterium]